MNETTLTWLVCLSPILLVTAFAVWQSVLTALADRWIARQEKKRKAQEWAVWARGVGAVAPRNYADAMPLCPGCGHPPEQCRLSDTCLARLDTTAWID